MKDTTKTDQTAIDSNLAVIGRCSSCKNWSRYNLIDAEIPSNIGACSELENDINYWDGIDAAQEKVKDSKIGAENLFTHENFGCIHYNGL